MTDLSSTEDRILDASTRVNTFYNKMTSGNRFWVASPRLHPMMMTDLNLDIPGDGRARPVSIRLESGGGQLRDTYVCADHNACQVINIPGYAYLDISGPNHHA